jgi:hypothetical protein
MQKCEKAQLRTVRLSEVETLRAEGYEPIAGGDAAKANSDYFMVMVKRGSDGAPDRIRILCPSFLRGGLGVSGTKVGFSY